MASDPTDKIDLTLRISEGIRSQADLVAVANGLKLSEQCRQIFLSGLRAEQQRLYDIGLMPSADSSIRLEAPEAIAIIKSLLADSEPLDQDAKEDSNAIALIKALAEKKEPSPDAVAVIAKQLNMAPHTLLSKLKSKEGNGAESRVTH